MLILPFVKGCLTTASLIMAIGPQNAFALKQGLLRNQVFVTALLCSLFDALLIVFGVGGLSSFLTSNEILLLCATWGGALFLFWYGFKSFRSAFRSQSLHADDAAGPALPTLKQTIVILLAVCFLNPHVYLDTIVLVGSIGAQFERHERPWFALGAIAASIIWFFTLCYGARLLAPLFAKPIAWKILDGAVGLLMWIIALSLII